MKALYPTLVTRLRLKDCNFEQFWNVYAGITVVPPMLALISNEQFLNAPSPKEEIEVNEADFRLLFLKAYSPIVLIFLASRLDILEYAKASVPIVLREDADMLDMDVVP